MSRNVYVGDSRGHNQVAVISNVARPCPRHRRLCASGFPDGCSLAQDEARARRFEGLPGRSFSLTEQTRAAGRAHYAAMAANHVGRRLDDHIFPFPLAVTTP